MTKMYTAIKEKICDNGRFCEDAMMLGLCLTVFYIMVLSIGQMTV